MYIVSIKNFWQSSGIQFSYSYFDFAMKYDFSLIMHTFRISNVKYFMLKCLHYRLKRNCS